MSAPLLWIILPAVLAIPAMLITNQRIQSILGGSVAALLALVAWVIPIDQALQLGAFSLKIAPAIQILGRRLVLVTADGPLLALFYGLIAMWFFGGEVTGTAHRLIPFGFMIAALLVASIAVEPFLYAAILIEIAILLSVPLLLPLNQTPGPGVVRFLIYQTLGMPFILFAGWFLAGVEASPGDLELAIQSATILGFGFAFLLAVFPLYTWLPMLAEEVSPYILGFLFWVLPTITIIFGMGFLDRYAWLRTSEQLGQILSWSGLLMVVTGGLFSAFQRQLSRQMAYAVIAETGFSLLALSLPPDKAVNTAFLLIIPRSIALLVWAMALSQMKEQVTPLRFRFIQGLARIHPITAAGLILAHFSVAGFPLLAGFPIRLALWEGLATQSLGTAFWFLVGILGLMTGATRTLAVLVMAPEGTGWELQERWGAGIMTGLGAISLFILGIFPQIFRPIMANLPAMFEHLGK